MKFSEKETIQFCELYRECECLWNMVSSDYKNKYKRQCAIESIIEGMDMPGLGALEVKNKIKNLRSTFNQEAMKIRRASKSGSGKEDNYTPSIKWFKILEPIMKVARDVTTNAISTEDVEGIQATEDDAIHSYPIDDDDGSNSSEPSPAPSTSTGLQKVTVKRPTPTPTVPPTLTIGQHGGYKRKFAELQSALKELRAANEILPQPQVEDSEAETFGKYVGECLSKFPPLQSALAQHDIQRVLTKYKLSLIDNSTAIAASVLSESGISLIPPSHEPKQSRND